MEEFRKEFEARKDIAKLITKGAYWDCENNFYDADYGAEITLNEIHSMDSEWVKFQELRKTQAENSNINEAIRLNNLG